jgi:ATP-dependent protease ClpP protease subunit
MSAIVKRRKVCLGLSALVAGAFGPCLVFAQEKDGAKTNSTAYLYFSQQIDEKSALELTNALINMRSKGYKTIYLMINSTGGEVAAGISLYHVLTSMDVTINTYALSNVDSVATLLFLAGKDRIVNKESLFGFHSARFTFNGGDLTPDQINQGYSEVEADNDRMKDIFKERLTIGDKQYDDFFRPQLRFVRAQEALSIGLATRMGEISMQPRDGFYFVPTASNK